MTATARPKVLIVDPRRANLHALERVLRELDAELLPATSVDAARDASRDHDLALALLTVGAPGMDGFALAEHLRGAEKTRLVPLIFLAAPEVGEQRLVEGYRKGAVDVLAEPCDPDILRAKVGVFVALARQRAELEDPRAPRTAVGERGASHELRASEERLKRAQAVAEVGLLDWNVETGEMVWSEPRAREV